MIIYRRGISKSWWFIATNQLFVYSFNLHFRKIIKQAPSQKRCSVFCICLYFTLKRNSNSDIAKPPPRFLSPPQTYWCVCIIFQFKVNLNKLTFEFNGPFGQFKKMQCEIKQLKLFIRHPLARKYHRSPFKLTYVLNNLL